MTGRRPNPFRPLPLPLGEAPADTPPLPLGEGRGEGASPPHRAPPAPRAARGFTLVELLVAVSIILILMTLVGGGISAARTTAKVNLTRQLIDKLDKILMQQLTTYDAKSVDFARRPLNMQRGAYRAWYIRRNMITADMPDRWTDVEYMYDNTDLFPTSPPPPTPVQFPKSQLSHPQRVYLGIWKSVVDSGRASAVKEKNSGAECLFMIVMRGGIGDCIDCGPLAIAQIGDTDGDGMPEFLDGWGNPVEYLLWAPAVVLPPESNTEFFSGARALTPFLGEDGNGNAILDAGEDMNGNGQMDPATPTLGMRPLIYSSGPDGKSGLERWQELANLKLPVGANGIPLDGDPPNNLHGLDCGKPDATIPLMLSPQPEFRQGGKERLPGDTRDYRGDNITNLDAEAKR